MQSLLDLNVVERFYIAAELAVKQKHGSLRHFRRSNTAVLLAALTALRQQAASSNRIRETQRGVERFACTRHERWTSIPERRSKNEGRSTRILSLDTPALALSDGEVHGTNGTRETRGEFAPRTLRAEPER
jgi:hypothetical protein